VSTGKAAQLATHTHDMTTTTELLLKMIDRPADDTMLNCLDCLETLFCQVLFYYLNIGYFHERVSSGERHGYTVILPIQTNLSF
jgi:hypothetical protein